MYAIICNGKRRSAVQAFVKLKSFRGGSSFYTWLYRITVNLALSRGRHRRVRQSLEETQDVTRDEPADPRGSASDLVMREERAHEIQRALASLSEDQRSILLLRGVEGFDYETIGRILNLPPEEREEGTMATVAVAIQNGANIVRVHEVKRVRRVVQVVDAILHSTPEPES